MNKDDGSRYRYDKFPCVPTVQSFTAFILTIPDKKREKKNSLIESK
jgi:hypothetical protein